MAGMESLFQSSEIKITNEYYKKELQPHFNNCKTWIDREKIVDTMYIVDPESHLLRFYTSTERKAISSKYKIGRFMRNKRKHAQIATSLLHGCTSIREIRDKLNQATLKQTTIAALVRLLKTKTRRSFFGINDNDIKQLISIKL